MKLSNLFKKATKNNKTASVQKLEMNQLEKVIGGTSATIVTPVINTKGINQSGIK